MQRSEHFALGARESRKQKYPQPEKCDHPLPLKTVAVGDRWAQQCVRCGAGA